MKTNLKLLLTISLILIALAAMPGMTRGQELRGGDLFGPTAVSPTPPQLIDAFYYGDAANQEAFGIEVASGVLHIAGRTGGNSALLLQYNLPNTTPTWSQTLAATTELQDVTAAGAAVFAAGAFTPPNCGASDGVGGTEPKVGLARYTAAGAFVSCRSDNFFPYKGYEFNYAVVSDGTAVYAAGGAEQSGFGPWRTALARYDLAGNPVWKRYYGAGSNGGSRTYDAVWLNGYLYLAGQNNDGQMMLLKVDAAAIPADPNPGGVGSTPLTPVWERLFNPGAGAYAYGLATDGTHLYITGYQNSGPFGGNDVIVLKYDQAGNLLWSKSWGGTGSDIGRGIAAANGRVFVTGETASFGGGLKDVFLLELDAGSGSELSTQYWGGGADDAAYAIGVDGDTLVVAGKTASFGAGGTDIAILRYSLTNPNQVQPATPKLLGRSSTWLAAWTPFTGDANGNSYTIYEYSTSPTGPWTAACGSGIPGESTWRGCAITGLTPGASYYVRVTFVDPDGVVGVNPKVYGPVTTLSTASSAVTINRTVTFVQDTYIQVATLIGGDANTNSVLQSVEVAPSSAGPWTQKCGPVSPFAPKLCRIHGLTAGGTYYLRVTIGDVDGVVGPAQEVIGPISYTGRTNLALNRPVTTNVPGWGCCGNPAELVDGRIQYPDWFYGFAHCGGLGNWGGCGAGWKNAVVDLGSVQTVSQFDWWPHDQQSIPTDWRVELSTDGVTYTEVAFTSDTVCRSATDMFSTGWYAPNCRHSASFAPTAARYVRYSFDDAGIFNGLHGWAAEIEVFGP